MLRAFLVLGGFWIARLFWDCLAAERVSGKGGLLFIFFYDFIFNFVDERFKCLY